MSNAPYLLPCTCGEKVPVDASQAGLTVRCCCGVELAVPTLRGLSKLERRQAQPAVRRAWGFRQAMGLCGATMVLVAVVAAVGLFLTAPTYPQDQIDWQLEAARESEDIQQARVPQLLDLWNELSRGIDHRRLIIVAEYEAAVVTYHRRLIALAVLAGAGVLIWAAAWSLRGGTTALRRNVSP